MSSVDTAALAPAVFRPLDPPCLPFPDARGALPINPKPITSLWNPKRRRQRSGHERVDGPVEVAAAGISVVFCLDLR